MGNTRWCLSVARPCALVLMLLLSPALLQAGFNRSKIPQIVCGKTTSAELERLIGKPNTATDNSDGTKMYSYVFENTRTGKKESRAILFDRTGVVTTAMGGQVDGPKKGRQEPIDEKRWALLSEGRSTEQEVVELLGPPAHRVTLGDGGSLWMYVAGEVTILPPTGINLQSRQVFNLCVLRFDGAGVLQSFQAD